MEGVGEASPPSSGTPTPGKSSTTSPAKVKANIGGTIPPPALVGVGGCSETASTTAEGKKLKTDMNMTGDGGEDVAVAPSSGVGKPQAETKSTEAEDEDSEASGSDSGMPPPVREQLHPLENPVILTHLFERCSPKLLAQCRLVSKQWWELSLTSWRTTAQLLLYQYPRGGKHLSFQQYLEFVDDPQNRCDTKPHRKMRLVRWKHDLTRPELQEFRNRIGSNLTSLEFLNGDFQRVEDLRWIIFRSCPNLQRLYLHNCRYLESALVEAPGEPEYVEPKFGEQPNLKLLSFQVFEEFYWKDLRSCRVPVPWLELLSHFPFLTSLKLSIRPLEGCDMAHEEIVKAIELIRGRDQRKLRLRILDLEPFKISTKEGPRPALLSRFQELKLPLQALEIQVDSTEPLMHPLLEEILSRHYSTFLRITVSREVIRDDSIISRLPFSWGHFPCDVMLENLEQLRIHMLFPSMEFLKNTPNLKKLEFLDPPGFGYSKEDETRIFPEQGPTTLAEVKLLHLTEFRMDYKVASEDVPILARLMPNVTKLTMTLNDELFSRVYQSWENLKEMEVLGEELTTKGVTGMGVYDYVRGWETSPARTNLKGLESFKFWSPNLTDRSVFQGFLRLPSLKRIEVCGREITFGAGAKTALRLHNISIQGVDYSWDEFVDEYDRDY